VQAAALVFEEGYALASFRWMWQLGLVDTPVPWSLLTAALAAAIVWLGLRGRMTCQV
jgi:hypothetical protein